MQAVTGNQSKILIFFSNSPKPLLATNRWPKSLRTLGTRLIPIRFCSQLHGLFMTSGIMSTTVVGTSLLLLLLLEQKPFLIYEAETLRVCAGF